MTRITATAETTALATVMITPTNTLCRSAPTAGESYSAFCLLGERRSAVEGVLGNRGRLHLDRKARSARRHVGRIADDTGIEEMFVQVVDILDHPTLLRP